MMHSPVDANEINPPPLLDPEVSSVDRTVIAARLVAAFALTLEEGEVQRAPGNVKRKGQREWTVRFEQAGIQVSIHVLNSKGPEYRKLDLDGNGRIEYEDFGRKLVDTFCTQTGRRHVSDERLNLAADLMQRINSRLEGLRGDHAELSLWDQRMETVEQVVLNTTYTHPQKNSSGKLFDVHYADSNRRHRLVYNNRSEQNPCSLSIRVVCASDGATYAMTPPHVSYGRAWLIVEQLNAPAELRRKILHVIQEESFKEPGPSGIERRAWSGAVALAHLANTNEFPDMRWGGPQSHEMSPTHYILRDDGDWAPVHGRLILLCQPLTSKTGHNPPLPVAVTVSRLPHGPEDQTSIQRKK